MSNINTNENGSELEAVGQIPDSPALTSQTRQPRRIILLVVLGIIIVGGAIAAYLVYGRLTGKVDLAAAAIPTDANIYVGVNFLEMTPDDMNRVLKALNIKIEDKSFSDAEGMFLEIDKSLAEDLGLTFTEDIRPWLGQYLGIGIFDVHISDSMEMDQGTIIFSVESRDNEAADQFITKLRAHFEQQGAIVEDQEYIGINLVFIPDREIAVARSKNLVLLSNKVEGIKSAVDSQKGESLQINPQFKEVSSELPEGRAMTVFVSMASSSDLFKETAQGQIGGSFGVVSNQLDAATSAGMSLAITTEGVQIDSVTFYDPQKLSDEMRSMLETTADSSKITSHLPADTIMVITGQGIDKAWNQTQSALYEELGSDAEESMELLNQQLGIDVANELIAYLNNEFGIAILPEGNPLLQQQLNTDIGLIILSRTNSPDKLLATVQKLNQTIAMQMMGAIQDTGQGDMHIFAIGDPSVGDVFAYGLNKEYFAIATTREQISDAFETKESLEDNPAYQELWTHFPKDTNPVLYMNIVGLFDNLSNGPWTSQPEYAQASKVFTNMPFIAAGAQPFRDNKVRATIIFFITPVE